MGPVSSASFPLSPPIWAYRGSWIESCFNPPATEGWPQQSIQQALSTHRSSLKIAKGLTKVLPEIQHGFGAFCMVESANRWTHYAQCGHCVYMWVGQLCSRKGISCLCPQRLTARVSFYFLSTLYSTLLEWLVLLVLEHRKPIFKGVSVQDICAPSR